MINGSGATFDHELKPGSAGSRTAYAQFRSRVITSVSNARRNMRQKPGKTVQKPCIFEVAISMYRHDRQADRTTESRTQW